MPPRDVAPKSSRQSATRIQSLATSPTWRHAGKPNATCAQKDKNEWGGLANDPCHPGFHEVEHRSHCERIGSESGFLLFTVPIYCSLVYV